MDEWETLTLAQAGVRLFDCVHKTPPAAETGLPYVAIPQMKNGELDLASARKIHSFHFEEWTKKSRPQPFDVVLSRRCNPGETAFVREGMKFALGQNLVLLRADGTRVKPRFLRWLVRTQYWWNQIEKFLNVGAVFDSLRCADVPNFELPIPPLHEQGAIAGLLGALDDKIELNRRISGTVEATARAIFKDWFVDFGPTRAKAEGRSPYLATEIWNVFPDALNGDLAPINWQVGRLADFADVIMGASPSGETYNTNGVGVPLVNGPAEYGEFFIESLKWTTAPTRLSRRGDLILCVRGSTTGRHVFSDGEYCLGRGVAAIRAKPGIQSFVDRLVLDDLPGLLTKATGSVFPNLASKDLQGFEVIKPPEALVTAFCKIVDPLRERCWRNVEESGTLASLRDMLLPRLLSGQIRLREAEKMVEEAA
jgi:type I restriction enzyme, S subunit